MTALFRVYLRTFDGQVSEKTITADQDAAAAAFDALLNRTDLDGQKMAAALTYENRQRAFHRFDRAMGDADYWRGRLDQIEWPLGPLKRRGGAREGAGAKAADGVSGVQRYNVTLDADSEALARLIGGGDRSLGIRRALAHARDSGLGSA